MPQGDTKDPEAVEKKTHKGTRSYPYRQGRVTEQRTPFEWRMGGVFARTHHQRDRRGGLQSKARPP